MNQEKIGKFIAIIRKEKKLTQKNLADKLGITDRAISKWENGKSLPDLSLLKPLCDTLDITINELLSGEFIKENKKEDKLEDNIVNAINYDKKRMNLYELIFQSFIIIFGILIFIMTMSIPPGAVNFYLWYSVLGTFVLIIIFSYLIKKIIICNKSRRYLIITVISFFISYLAYLGIIDFINVKKYNGEPSISVVSTGVYRNTFTYDTWFYDLYICNNNQKDEYRKIVFDMEYVFDIDKIDKYCNK